MFAISRCPFCGRLHGLELPAGSTTCRLCNRRYDPSKGSVVRTFSTDTEMRAFLQGAASIDAGSDEPVVDLAGARTAMTARSSTRPGRGRIVKMILTELKERPKSWADLSPLSQEGDGPAMLEECLDMLMDQGLIFRGKDGRYALVE